MSRACVRGLGGVVVDLSVRVCIGLALANNSFYTNIFISSDPQHLWCRMSLFHINFHLGLRVIVRYWVCATVKKKCNVPAVVEPVRDGRSLSGYDRQAFEEVVQPLGS